MHTDVRVEKVNPLTLKSDQYLNSPYNISPESNTKNNGNDHQLKKLLIVKQILLAEPQEINREQYGEYAY